MPAKFRIKQYKAGGIYHIYNRGLDGRSVCDDETDFVTFEKLLRQYLTGTQVEDDRYKSDKPSIVLRKQRMSLTGQIEMVAYCLMPDHIHLLVRQKTADAITKLMRRVMTAYVMAYNLRHKRRGPLFEMAYRAVLVDTEEKALHLTRWIHLNPVVRSVVRLGFMEGVTTTSPDAYLYSSYTHYIGKNVINWVNSYRGKMTQNDYQNWVENPKIDSKAILGELTID